MVQPPKILFTTPLDEPRKRFPRPTGNSQTDAACRTWVRSNSERPRSIPKSRMSVGVREFVLVSPPPDEAPTGSTDWLSIDLAKVYAMLNPKPLLKRRRNVNCAA